MPARLRSVGSALALLLLASGCGGPQPAPPSIVLVSIDSLRADRLGCYGAERDTSPAIDALAARGARFEHAIAPTPWTLPSHVTLLTALPVPAHRVRAPDQRLDPARRLLAEHLADQGYRTAAFVSAPFLHRAYGFDRGFEVYRNFQSAEVTVPPSRSAHDASHGDETAPEVVDAALAWLEGRRPGSGPWFLFVHLWDVHYDFLPPPPYDRLFDPDYEGDLDPRDFENNEAIRFGMPERDLAYLRALYDGEIRWIDSHLGRLFDALRRREPHEPIVVSLVSDHGDEFFEHGHKGHFRNLYEESLRVPWIVRAPGVPAGSVVRGVAGLEDVAPTLLGLAGLPPLPEARGDDLSEALRSGGAAREPVLISFGTLFGIRGPDWKIVVDRATGRASFYDLDADPGERRPRAAAEVAPDALARVQERFEDEQAYGEGLSWEGGGAVALDAPTRERLRELGYLDGGASE